MVKEKAVGVVARILRHRIFRGEFTGGSLPSERVLMRQCEASRHTVRFALGMLAAEGLVTSVQGHSWRANEPWTEANFELFMNRFEWIERTRWPDLVSELLEFRRRQVLHGVEQLLLSGATVSSQLDFAVFRASEEQRTREVLALEDAIFVLLMSPSGRLLETLAANQLRRAFERLRQWLDFPPYRSSEPHDFKALLAAINAGDRARALHFAERALAAHDPLYLRQTMLAALPFEAEADPEVFAD